MVKAKKIIDEILKWVLVILVAGMTINVLWQVFTRFILQSPSSFTEELARYSLVWAGILGAAYVAGQKMHLAIDILLQSLKGKSKLITETIINVFIFLFAFFVMIIGGAKLVNLTLTLNQLSASLQIPLGYVYLVLPISGTLICFYTTHFIIENAKSLLSKPSAQ